MKPANSPAPITGMPPTLHRFRLLPDWLDTGNLRRLMLFGFLITLFVLLPEAMADSILPSGSLGIPGTSDGESWSSQMIKALSWGLKLLLLLGLGIGIAMSIFTLFRLVNDARSTGEWGPVIQQVVIVIVIIVFAFVLFGIANKYVFEPLDKMAGSSTSTNK